MFGESYHSVCLLRCPRDETLVEVAATLRWLAALLSETHESCEIDLSEPATGLPRR